MRKLLAVNLLLSYSYDDVDDLEKIESLKINATKCGDLNIGTNEDILYTCRKGECGIPCMCKDCCKSEPQCKMHRIRHEEVFNYDEDSMTIRSSEMFFRDSTFLTTHTLSDIQTFLSNVLPVLRIYCITTCTI